MTSDKRVPLSRKHFLYGALTAGVGVAGASLGPAFAAPTPPGPPAAPLPRTLREKVEQLFVVSFAGTTPQNEIVSLLHRHAVGGVALFARNCVNPAQIRGLLLGLQRTARYPLLVCTDEEGGGVTRITKGVPPYPWEATYGQSASAAQVQHAASLMATAIRGMGLSMNLAPVVDVLSNPRSPIGLRSYSSNPRLAAQLSVAAIRGYQSHGLAATAKHFIGLGHTSTDSHALLPVVNLTWKQLESTDLIPFRAAIAAGVSTVLVAHVALPRIDSVRNRPASLSPVIMNGKLRKTLRFNGVVMTDSLVMGAVSGVGSAAAAEQAFVAGADILLFAFNENIPTPVIEDAMDRVYAAVKSGRIPESRLDASLARIAALKRRYPAKLK